MGARVPCSIQVAVHSFKFALAPWHTGRSLALAEAKKSGEFIVSSVKLSRKNAIDAEELMRLPLLYVCLWQRASVSWP